MCSLFSTIQDNKVHPEEEDRLVWNQSKDGCFSVKSLYGVLERLREGPFSRNLIWNFCLPLKVSFFCLGSVVGEILTMDKLKKMGRHLANRCPLCGKDGENIDHLFLHCMLAREL